VKTTDLKSRLRFELLSLAAIAIVFLTLVPQRPIFIEIALALLGLLLLSLNINFTNKVVWRQFPPNEDKKTRTRAAYNAVMAMTLSLMVMSLGAGVAFGYSSNGWDGVWHRISNWHILITICLYLPWALLQQTLFQYYLLGRLLNLLSPRLAIIFTGMAFGLVHLPDLWITLATVAMGIIWTYWYYRYRVLTPLALSHATLGSTFYYWVYGRDLFEAWTEVLG
jgi:membrane protease YdiL (CAAX protease family)